MPDKFEAAVRRVKRNQKPSGAIERSSAKRLIPDKQNPNCGTPRGAEVIEQSLERLGAGRSIVIDRKGRIIAGNQTVKAFQKLGRDDIDIVESDGKRLIVVKRTDLDLDEGGIARELSLADNRTQELSYEVDPAIFASLDESIDLSWMYTEEELAAIVAENAPAELLTDEDDVPEPPKVPVSKRGQVWVLGRHRLMCGDSTSSEDVAKLMGSAQPLLMVTDPPYGVEYNAGWRNEAMPEKNDPKRCKDGAGRAVGKVSNDDRTDWREAWELFSGRIAYVWHAGRHASVVQQSLESCGFVIRNQVIWAKQQFAISRGDYHWQHEPCWYAVRDKGYWQGDRKQTTLWQIDKPVKSETGHSTQKPVECMRRPILNNSKPGESVYDPFTGSGTTLIACETEGRSAICMELDPVYVDVIITRWENATGQKAVLDGTEQRKVGRTSSKQQGKQQKEQAGRSPRPKHHNAPARARAT